MASLGKEESSESKDSSNCLFFRPKKRFNPGQRRNFRGRKDSDDDEKARSENDNSDDNSNSSDDNNESVVRFNSARRRRGGIRVGNVRKRRRVDDQSDSSGSDNENADDGVSETSRVSVVFGGSGAAISSDDQRATATFELDTAKELDHRSLEERAKATRQEAFGETNPLEDKTYRGLKSYAKFVEKKESPAGSKMSVGPQRAPANVRATVRWDYEPNLCKDYKETGFCGFGDSCKFLHDRTDYKFGWQLEREHARGGGDVEENYEISDSDEDSDLPFKCFICRDSFKPPVVVTKCRHYFCESCALNNYRKSQRCFACGKQTGGVFNPAKEIMDKLKKEQLERDKEQLAQDQSDDDSDG